MADLHPSNAPSSSPPDSQGPDDTTEASENSEEKSQTHRKRNLTNEERLEMAAFLFKNSQGEGRLPRSAITAAADKFKVHRNTASRIWNLMKPALDRGAVAEAMTVSVLSRKRGNCGRKKKDYSAEMERVKQLPADQRGSLRALSSAVGVPRTTLFRLLRDKETMSEPGDQGNPACSVKLTITDTIKPPLSEKNKRERLRFCYSKLRPNGLFDDMFNVVHVNTKWCSLPSTRDAKKAKVMFLVAVARPQRDVERQQHPPPAGDVGLLLAMSAALEKAGHVIKA
ncbi:hypothetical protein BBP00_00005623 [Phytophthora kernoviae]|uniref:DUF7769 domain-containing protein n=1 Tax=Phytophthora kernoviae TaxID=325452 RepID=A0A3F2RPY1_9STRA|nr:hypothetical protein BBP00_00005623 [Phytophthora kernoviae]